ncbi:MAG: hypothetical protein IK092_02950, partial [Muribaculaceae bacterium]|nr:hypothetical protein [Muribaculaceae bacterium]
MLKKLLTLVLLLAAFSLKAQFGVGDWRIHPAYVGTNAQNIIDAGDKVYYLVSNNLYCFDKETLENESLNKRNSLSDVLITNIFYNPAEDQVVITYDDSNIDIITSTGKIVNMPDIKDAVIASEKNINNITFNGSLMYVATSFGYVVIDNDKFEVKESRIFNKVINSVAIVGDYIIMLQDDKLYYGLTSQHHETLSSFQTIDGTFTSGQLFPISDTKFFLNAAAFSVYTISGSGSELTFTPTQIVAAHADNIQKTPSGFLANFLAKNYYYTFDQNGGTAKRTSAGKEMFSACAKGDGTLWAVGASGLHRSGDTDNYYKPDGVGMAQPFWLNYNEALGKLYVSNTTTNAFFTANSNTILYTYDGTKWEEMTPTPAFTGGSYWWEFDPEDPETYYLSAWTTGVHKVKGRERIVTYNASNSPL